MKNQIFQSSQLLFRLKSREDFQDYRKCSITTTNFNDGSFQNFTSLLFLWRPLRSRFGPFGGPVIGVLVGSSHRRSLWRSSHRGPCGGPVIGGPCGGPVIGVLVEVQSSGSLWRSSHRRSLWGPVIGVLVEVQSSGSLWRSSHRRSLWRSSHRGPCGGPVIGVLVEVQSSGVLVEVQSSEALWGQSSGFGGDLALESVSISTFFDEGTGLFSVVGGGDEFNPCAKAAANGSEACQF